MENNLRLGLVEKYIIIDILFIINSIISIILFHNEKKELEIGNGFIPKSIVTYVAALNKTLLIIIYLSIFYIALISYEKSKSRSNKLDLVAATIRIIAPIIVLVAYFIDKKENNTINPIL